MKTECGLIGTFINKPVSKEDLYYTLYEIQHRGQDSYGFLTIKSNANTNIELTETNKDDCKEELEGQSGLEGKGLVIKIIKEKGLLPSVDQINIDSDGMIFLGHMKYSTNTGIENLDASLVDCNIQPVEISKEYGIYIAHNGNLPNLKKNMIKLGLGD